MPDSHDIPTKLNQYDDEFGPNSPKLSLTPWPPTPGLAYLRASSEATIFSDLQAVLPSNLQVPVLPPSSETRGGHELQKWSAAAYRPLVDHPVEQLDQNNNFLHYNVQQNHSNPTESFGEFLPQSTPVNNNNMPDGSSGMGIYHWYKQPISSLSAVTPAVLNYSTYYYGVDDGGATTSNPLTVQTQNPTVSTLAHDISRVNLNDLLAEMDNYKLASPNHNRPLKCGFFTRGNNRCCKSFGTHEEIEEHIRDHFKNVRYLCFCGRTFTKKSTMQRHTQVYL